MFVTDTGCTCLPDVCPSLGHPPLHLFQSPLAIHPMHSSIDGVASLGQGVMAITIR